MLEGSCLCGTVKYEVHAAPALMYHCHCVTCRRASGASFATNMLVSTDAFMVVGGREILSSYESSPGKRRYFCSGCGSPIYSHGESTRHFVSVRCGTLRTDPGIRPSYHSYVASGAPWTVIGDDLPQMPEGMG